MQLLVESNANPEITCNLGDTPASIAYSNDHTELRDWLESITSSSSRGGGAATCREPISLPTFAENKQSTRYDKASFGEGGWRNLKIFLALFLNVSYRYMYMYM